MTMGACSAGAGYHRDGHDRTPRDEAELLARAHAIRGSEVEWLAAQWGAGGAWSKPQASGVRTKGKVGELVERALGAHSGSAATGTSRSCGWS